MKPHGQVSQFFDIEAEASGLLVKKYTGAGGTIRVDFMMSIGTVMIELDEQDILSSDKEDGTGNAPGRPLDALDRRDHLVDLAVRAELPRPAAGESNPGLGKIQIHQDPGQRGGNIPVVKAIGFGAEIVPLQDGDGNGDRPDINPDSDLITHRLSPKSRNGTMDQ